MRSIAEAFRGYRAAGWLAGLIALLAWGCQTSSAAEDAGLRLGVQTCANSTCHASPSPSPGSNVEQNEFLVWSEFDKHSKSFAALKSPRGQQIADNLGLGPADKANECLNCHTDNVPVSQRGKRFRLEDGVGCEACHGGGANWLGTHSSASSHAENVAAGMYPTDNPTARAKLCLGCHLFRDNEPSQHRYYAAGHPRLHFELDTYTEERPGHHKIDADYRRRKPGSYGARAWVLGQAAVSRKIVDRLLASSPDAFWPSYDAFACFGCHIKFAAGQPGGHGFPPLQDASIRLTALSLNTFGSPIAAKIDEQLAQLNKLLGSNGGKSWRAAAQALGATLAQAEKELAARSEHEGDAAALYKALLAKSVSAEVQPHHFAEQVTYAVATLRQNDPGLAKTNIDETDKALDGLFKAAGMAASFNAGDWRVAAQGLQQALPAGSGN